jgi:hypothetical protein
VLNLERIRTNWHVLKKNPCFNTTFSSLFHSGWYVPLTNKPYFVCRLVGIRSSWDLAWLNVSLVVVWCCWYQAWVHSKSHLRTWNSSYCWMSAWFSKGHKEERNSLGEELTSHVSWKTTIYTQARSRVARKMVAQKSRFVSNNVVIALLDGFWISLVPTENISCVSSQISIFSTWHSSTTCLW